MTDQTTEPEAEPDVPVPTGPTLPLPREPMSQDEALSYDTITIGEALSGTHLSGTPLNQAVNTHAKTARGMLLYELANVVQSRDADRHAAALHRAEATMYDRQTEAKSDMVGSLLGAVRKIDKGTTYEEDE